MNMLTSKVNNNLYDELIKASPFFQRSINLKYDSVTGEHIKFYKPTPKAIEAFEEFFASCINEKYQGAYILSGPYGAGKSLFSLVLMALLEQPDYLKEYTNEFLKNLLRLYPNISNTINEFLDSGKKYLPVILSGDEGSLNLALSKALVVALRQRNITDINPPTIYNAVKDKILEWQSKYPNAYYDFQNYINNIKGISVEQFIYNIELCDVSAYRTFLEIYPKVTAGAEFNFMYNQSPVEIFEQVAGELYKKYDYDGIFVIHDEFGRFLESRIGQPFGFEAELLQDFAEYCNRTYDPKVNLVCITHKVMSQYAQGLSEDVRLEWQKIEGRFKSLSLSGDPEVTYKLLKEALYQLNQSLLQKYLDEKGFYLLQSHINKAIDLNILDLPPEDTFEILKGVYPLHPMTVYCLPELSEKIAQNERTLFTFLFSKDEYSLGELLSSDEFIKKSGHLPFIYVDQIYNYFSEAMKIDTRPGGVHEFWSYAEGALKKIPFNEVLARRIIKSLAIIHAIRKSFSHRPNDELLAYTLGMAPQDEQYKSAINYLIKNKFIIYRTSAGCWEFLNRSDIDINRKVEEVLESYKPNEHILRVFLEKNVKPIYYPARRYIDQYGTIRYFTGIYRTIDEIEQISDWESILEEGNFTEKEGNYSDGLVVFILASDQAQLARAESYVRSIEVERVIFVFPEYPIKIFDALKEMFALSNLQNKLTLKEEDPRVEKELEFLFEDARENVKSELKQLTDPAKSVVWYHKREILDIKSFSEVCRYIAKICIDNFPKTPIINNEALNRKNPSTQQIKASQKVIDGMLKQKLEPMLGLKGNGPDVAIYKTVLKNTGIVKQSEDGDEIRKPLDANLAELWEKIENYIINTNEEISIDELINKLQKPPWGLRRGIIPVILSAILSRYLSNITLKYRGHVVFPIRGKKITELVRAPNFYSLVYHKVGDFEKRIMAVLQNNFCDNKTSQIEDSLYNIAKSINEWHAGLSIYAKQTSNISEEASRFREIVKKSFRDPYNNLIVELPNILGVRKSSSSDEINVKIYKFKNELEKDVIYYLQNNIEDNLVGMFDYEGNAKESAQKWINEIQNMDIDLATYRTGDVYADILLSYCFYVNCSKDEWLDGLTKDITGLSLEYWTDRTEEMFYNIIKDAKNYIERELNNEKVSGYENLVEISLRNSDGKNVITFKKAELSTSASNLLNTLKRSIDTTGRHLNQDERMEIGVELLQYLLQGKKG